ncbi:cation:proton antiporter [Nanoarchaeota archaeon]
MHPLLVLLIVITLAYALGEVCRKTRMPRVVGYIFAGLLLGVPQIRPYLLTDETGPLLDFMSQMGILLLFFFVGLQVDMKKFQRHISESILVSVFNTLLPLVIGAVAMHYIFGVAWIGSVIVGMCLAMSAQAVSVDVLEELGMLRSKIGRIIITSGTIDDVFELGLISVVFALIHAVTGQASTTQVLGDAAIFVIAIIAFRYVIVPVLLNLFAAEQKLSALFTGAVVITLIMAVVTEYLGLGAIIGALFAGLIVREVLLTGNKKQVWEEHNIAKAIHIISFGLFVPIFFVWVGMKTDITAIFTNTGMMITMVIIALFGTVVGTIIGVLLHKGGTFHEGLIVGWGVAPKGDVELVIAILALGRTLIGPDVYSALVLMAFFTTLISPLVFRYVLTKYSKKKVKPSVA